MTASWDTKIQRIAETMRMRWVTIYHLWTSVQDSMPRKPCYRMEVVVRIVSSSVMYWILKHGEGTNKVNWVTVMIRERVSVMMRMKWVIISRMSICTETQPDHLPRIQRLLRRHQQRVPPRNPLQIQPRQQGNRLLIQLGTMSAPAVLWNNACPITVPTLL